MVTFVRHTIGDLKSGRESWRVFAALCMIAFTASFALQSI